MKTILLAISFLMITACEGGFLPSKDENPRDSEQPEDKPTKDDLDQDEENDNGEEEGEEEEEEQANLKTDKKMYVMDLVEGGDRAEVTEIDVFVFDHDQPVILYLSSDESVVWNIHHKNPENISTVYLAVESGPSTINGLDGDTEIKNVDYLLAREDDDIKKQAEKESGYKASAFKHNFNDELFEFGEVKALENPAFSTDAKLYLLNVQGSVLSGNGSITVNTTEPIILYLESSKSVRWDIQGNTANIEKIYITEGSVNTGSEILNYDLSNVIEASQRREFSAQSPDEGVIKASAQYESGLPLSSYLYKFGVADFVID